MILTIGNVIWLMVVFVICVFVLGIVVFTSEKENLKKILEIGIPSIFAILGILFGLMVWYNTNTESGRRAIKDTQSELNGGIYREITITAEDGREIFYYKGKVDVEMNHTDNYIKFESEDNKRYIIYYGIQDTIKIIECEE